MTSVVSSAPVPVLLSTPGPPMDFVARAVERALSASGPDAVSTPFRLTILDDCELVAEGLAAMLAPFSSHVTVLEAAAVTALRQSPDIELVDLRTDDPHELDRVVTRSAARRLVIYTWRPEPGLAEHWIAHGAAGVLAKALPAEELFEALVRIDAGETLVAAGSAPAGLLRAVGRGTTVRSPRLRLVEPGLVLSSTTVRSILRTAYQKVGDVRRRAAVPGAHRRGLTQQDPRSRPGVRTAEPASHV